ncbi:hypothetical protein EMQ25_14675 [Arsenicitalea aurantiaca]|uniref:Uncharacterized protein n=1 Tax=Arsenicitalea aurantiaca TaxID=1783274 RepID=A0A433X5P0_9HYPH|nr:hypothetical protein [Arsenicitalea aurantiaca]RUT29361.1 hypothetical protein EMQ25_14675 [Arsenicitalea aurantiaca]
MSENPIEARLARIEAAQTDLGLRLTRIEGEGQPSRFAPPPPAEREGPNWARIGVIILVVLAALWLIDEMPGPNLLDRIF